MGPQHGRIIEAYFTGKSLVVRPIRLYDFRKKDADAFKTLCPVVPGEADWDDDGRAGEK